MWAAPLLLALAGMPVEAASNGWPRAAGGPPPLRRRRFELVLADGRSAVVFRQRGSR
jgi:hypothetical protein